MEEAVHVIPIGFEEDRAVYGLMELGANRIYLLVDNKSGEWGKKAREHAATVEIRLKQMLLNPTNLSKVSFDPTSFESCEQTITRILDKEKTAQRVFVNVSTSTKLCAVAFALRASEYPNTFLYYVVPKAYNVPMEGQPFSSGAQRVEVFSPRVGRIGEWEHDILHALDQAPLSSLGELNQVVVPEDVSKSTRAKLSYYVRKLSEEGYVNFVPGRKLEITTVGRAKLHPPQDETGQ